MHEKYQYNRLDAGPLPMSSAHSMNARKCVHAQKPCPSQAFAHESSKVGGRGKGEEERQERQRKKRGRGKREKEEKERKRKKRERGKREKEEKGRKKRGRETGKTEARRLMERKAKQKHN